MDMFHQFMQQHQQITNDFNNQQRLAQEQSNAIAAHQQLTNTASPSTSSEATGSSNFDRVYELTNKLIDSSLTPEERTELDARQSGTWSA